ncbi:MAG: S8 family peptidase [Planctomycetes bacterium]|nr:S8 family peptidase [Planctomycetota bacterium]
MAQWHLPPFTVLRVMTARTQVVDWGLTALGVPDLWKQTKGKGVRVAVIDTGMPDHPDLVPAIQGVQDFTGSQFGPRDVQGHSTHCCGIIGARDNQVGTVGVAPECDLICAKVLGDNGAGESDWVAAGVRWAVQQKADVISMSLGSPEPDEGIHAALQEAVAAGVFLVCAAGNSGPAPNSVEYPGKFPETVAVGSINQQLQVSQFSSRGPEVAVVAPGEKITSTYLNCTVAVLSGTSMATPFVAGVVALAVAHRRDLGRPLKTQADLLNLIHQTATHKGRPAGEVPDFGWGLLDPKDVVDPADSPPPVLPPAAGDGLVGFGPGDFTPGGLAKAAALLGQNRGITLQVR